MREEVFCCGEGGYLCMKKYLLWGYLWVRRYLAVLVREEVFGGYYCVRRYLGGY